MVECGWWSEDGGVRMVECGWWSEDGGVCVDGVVCGW